VISAGSVLRGRALEITDDEGRTRASIKTEYLHWDLGRANYSLSGASLATTATIPALIPGTPAGIAPVGAFVGSTASTRISGDFVRASVNYKFD